MGYRRVMVAAAAERVLTSYHWLGIPIALAGALLLSLGTLFQHRGFHDSAAAPARRGGTGGAGGMGAGDSSAWCAGPRGWRGRACSPGRSSCS